MSSHYEPISEMPYMTKYGFETIDLPYWRNWFAENWTHSLYIGAAYVAFIFLGQKFMKSREPFDLRGPLALWNFSMSIFSAFAFVRVYPELLYLLRKPEGLYKATCSLNEHGQTMAFWALTYTLSKALLLGDTVFIVLRKKKLILLHWFHHLSAMVISWYAYPPYIPMLRFVGNMNYFVHAWMYGYYGLKAMEVKLPKQLTFVITIFELIQMMIGLGITLFAVYEYNYGRGCVISARSIAASSLIYSALFVLFARHFNETVLNRAKYRKDKMT